MAYLTQDDPDLIKDIVHRKEFYWLRRWNHDETSNVKDIIPRFMLDNEIARSGYLRLLGHQIFVENFMNPNTDYKRLHVKWSTGSGKTLAGLAIAMNFIRNYSIERELGNIDIGSIFIIGFSERAFKNELLKYPEFGFLSKEERIRLDKLKKSISSGNIADLAKYKELTTRVKKRFGNRKGNGFFRFYGYKAFVNRIFITGQDVVINELSEEGIRQALISGRIKFNQELLDEFKNSLIVCDEIHNVYNSAEKNNWGVAIQSVLDAVPDVRCVTLSATPLNNNPAEIVDLLNLLLPTERRVTRSDFFSNDKDLKPGALEKIAELSRGRFSFLIDVNPKYYPKIINLGYSLKEIPYLKFERCVMSDFHYKTYKEVYTGTLSQDSQYLVDFALPNPEDPNGIGIYQTGQIKKLLPYASQKFKDKYHIDYRNNKIVGDFMKEETIGKYSAKYKKVLETLRKDIREHNGKIFIYHNVVHMSGVLFIEQMLLQNGYIDEFSTSSDNTICFTCGLPRNAHHKDEISGGAVDIDEPDTDLIVDEIQHASVLEQDDYYMIQTQSKELLRGELLDSFDSFIDKFRDKPLKVKIKNHIGKKLGDWLLSHGFELDYHNSTHSILIRKADVQGTSGGALKRRSTKHRSTKHNSAKHNSAKHNSAKHRFTPVRFVMAHSDIDKAQMEHSIERFNGADNLDGSKFLILIGSKIIKESYDIKALQNEYIISRPDNIPTFIQIRGRAVRKGSHIGLPPENQVVRITIFTSCLPVKQTAGVDKGQYQLSYEEEKYREKVASFQVIQNIEKVIHENAIDSLINFSKMQREMTDDPLGPLPYKPVDIEKNKNEMNLSQLNTSTFNLYHAKSEVEIIKLLVKRLFIELSSVWEYTDLLNAVRNPPKKYETEVNNALIDENNFMIAMSQLIWNDSSTYTEPFITRTTKHHVGYTGGSQSNAMVHETDVYDTGVYDTDDMVAFAVQTQMESYTGGTHSTQSEAIKSTIIDHLFDSNDKIIALPGGQDNIIVPIAQGKLQFYILFPIDSVSGSPEIDIELPYRILKQEENHSININSFIQSKRIDFDYDDKKKLFYRKYSDIAIENMQNTVCEYGTTFHIKFIEECIEYVFRAWTDPTLEKHDMHDFYFKMLYYYDLLSLIMWAYTSKPRVFREYNKYAIPVRAKDIKLKAMQQYENRKEELEDISPDDTSDLATSGVINLLKSTFNRTSNAWIPAEFREQYSKTIEKSLSMFNGRKKKNKFITKTSADLLPIGHYISKFPRLYLPDKGWDENPTYLQNEQEYKENNILIGFDERSNTGVHIRFKIRNPIHNIKKHKDSRQTEKGTVCKSKSKEYLKHIARKLDVVLPDKVNVEDLCVAIRSKLIRLELKERIKKSNIKYFYFFYEQRPETKHMASG
jgi:hypothetical protein